MLGSLLLTGDSGVSNAVEINVRESKFYLRLLIAFKILLAIICNQISHLLQTLIKKRQWIILHIKKVIVMI